MTEGIRQHYFKIANISAKQQYRMYVSNILKVGTSHQCKNLGYILAVFHNWEQFSNVTGQSILQQFSKVGNILAV